MRSLIILAFISTPALASGDDIGRPSSCPSFSHPIECHGPDTCAPDACRTDADCGGGRTCVEERLCTRTHCCGGMSGCAGGSSIHVIGPCANGACGERDSACTALRVCSPVRPLARPRSTEPEATQTSSCAAAPPRRSTLARILACTAMLLTLVRSRRSVASHKSATNRAS